MTDLFWTEAESRLYSLLVDHPDNCPWAIRDIIRDEGVASRPALDLDLRGLTSAVEALVTYCGVELARNERLMPARLNRQGRYPLIRQMRDVHEFDVGSHLALAGTLMLRRAPETYLQARGCGDVVATMATAAAQLGWLTMAYSAVLHDFMKCFRRRRPLPEKNGVAGYFSVTLPDGSTLPEEQSDSEEAIAALILPVFVTEVPVSHVLGIMDASAECATSLYRLEGIPTSDAGTYLEHTVPRLGADPIVSAGHYLAVVDWLAKGYARFVVTRRKGKLRTLEESGLMYFSAVQATMSSTSRGAGASVDQ